MFKKTLLAALILGGVQAQAFDLSGITPGNDISASIFHSEKLDGALDVLGVANNLIVGDIDPNLKDYVVATNMVLALGGVAGVDNQVEAMKLSAQYQADLTYSCTDSNPVAATGTGTITAKLSELTFGNDGKCNSSTGATLNAFAKDDAEYKAVVDALDDLTDSTKIAAALEVAAAALMAGSGLISIFGEIHNAALVGLDK